MESATGLSIIRRVMAFTMAAAIGLLFDGPRAQQVVPLDALNTPNDEVLLGWDGSDLFYRSIPRTSDTVKAGEIGFCLQARNTLRRQRKVGLHSKWASP